MMDYEIDDTRMAAPHGDVLMVPIKAIPAGVQWEAGTRHVLALGEVTGHAHVLEGARLGTLNGERFLDVGEAAVVRHEEHGPDYKAPGAYVALQQIEGTVIGGVRRVAD